MVAPMDAAPVTHESLGEADIESEENVSTNSRHDEVSINKIGTTRQHNLLLNFNPKP